MDNLIQKFYSNGKEEEQKYTQFGAFSNSLLKNSGTKFNFIKPNISVVNPAIHNVETKIQISIPKTPNKDIISNNTYLNPKKLIFNSSSDLFNQNIPKNNFAYSTKNNNDINQEPIPSLKTVKQNINTENKKNSTKMQMMEEKMKNLELKSQRLEVINDFFFDMFENNLVKEELKRQKEIKEIKEEKEKNEEDIEKEESENPLKNNEKKRRRKNGKKKKEIVINNPEEEEEQMMNEFIEKTDKISRKYLNNIKTDLGLALVEKQLQKNELLNDITEEILDLKGDLMNKLERLEMKQKAEIKTIAYCLQNSGDDKVENLATRLFGEDILKPDEEILNYNSGVDSMNTTDLKFTGSVFNTNLFKTKVLKETRRASINKRRSSIDKRRSSIDTRRASINKRRSSIDKRRSSIDKRRSSIDDGNRIRRKSTILDSTKNVIIEEKDD